MGVEPYFDATRHPDFTYDELGRVRVQVESAAGVEVFPGVIGADPPAAQANMSEYGWVEWGHPFEDDPAFRNPKITLDNGNVIWGYECWWKPVAKDG